MKRLKNISANADMSDNQVKFFYKGEYLGSCDPNYMECDKLYELIKSDSRAATQVLNYMNSLGDPVFPTKEGGYEPETDVSKVDPLELYNTFMQELDYSYRDFPKDFYVGGDYIIPDFEIFIDSSDEVVTSTKIKASRYDNVPGYKTPKGGYLYIFKHGIGPGTMPKDVEIIKTKDLPNYYTAVWLSDFLTTDELKQYDIPDETRINSILDSIGYCQKNGDVVPCDDVEACGKINGATEPNSPNADKTKLVRQVIKQAKEIRDYFQSHNNNLNRKQEQYLEDLSDGIDNESVAAIRDAIENMKYNSKNLRSEQYNLIMDLYEEFNFAGGKFEGMGYPEDDIDACNKVTSSNKTRFMANMVSASSFDSAYDENDELYQFHVAGYLNENYYHLMTDWYTNDFEEALDHALDMSAQGLYVEMENQVDGRSRKFTPDEWEDAVADGDVPDHVREDLVW